MHQNASSSFPLILEWWVILIFFVILLVISKVLSSEHV